MLSRAIYTGVLTCKIVAHLECSVKVGRAVRIWLIRREERDHTQ